MCRYYWFFVIFAEIFGLMSKCILFLMSIVWFYRLPVYSQALSAQAWDSIAVCRMDSLSREADDSPYFTGICVYDLTSDSLLYGKNHHKLMRPASILKLITAISALDQLGPDYPFETRVRICGTLVRNGSGHTTLRGRITVRGSMDPLVRQGDLHCVIDTLRRLGVDRLEGGIFADRSMKCDTTTLGPGWCWDDDNPRLDPMLNISVGKLASSVRQAGIEIVRDDNTPSEPVISDFVCASHTVNQVLQRMMKNSDNQHAESMMCLLGSLAKGNNTEKDRFGQIRKTIAKTDQPYSSVDISDGSGLSLYDYVTPRMIIAFLKYAYQNDKIRSALLPSLPIAGKDGTLANRMRTSSGALNVRAKTGTVSHVASLAGYLTAPTGHTLAFVIISNGSRRAASPRNLQDSLCKILTQ